MSGLGEARSSFKDKTILITGAGKGLGKAYAAWFASRGARVVVNNRARSGMSSAAMVADEIRAAGGVAIHDDHSVEDAEGAKAMVQAAIDAFGRLDVLICNAGIAPAEAIAVQDVDISQFRHMMDVNFYGTLNVLQAALPHLYKTPASRVIATTSSVGFFPGPCSSPYAASKTALIGLIRAVAVEGEGRGLRANLLAPMAITPMSEAHFDPKYRSLLSPGHVTKVVGWLASEGCEDNGAIFVAGGGNIYRVSVVQSPGQPIADGNVAAALGAMSPIAAGSERPLGTSTVLDLIQEFDRNI